LDRLTGMVEPGSLPRWACEKKKKMYDSDGGQVVAAHCGDKQQIGKPHKMSRFSSFLHWSADN
jgi:hypothetical protein